MRDAALFLDNQYPASSPRTSTEATGAYFFNEQRTVRYEYKSAFVKFSELAIRWREETGFSSSLQEIVLNKNYQRIIGMGTIVVKFILEDLKSEPDHWFWALASITGENPALNALPGDLEDHARLWLDWGRRRGIVA